MAAPGHTPKKGDRHRGGEFTQLLKQYSEEAAAIEAERRAKKRLKPVEGYPFWPHEVVRDTILILVFTGIVFYLSAFMPYFLETPADPRGPPAVILPDWYLLWSYGILKITDDVTLLSGFANEAWCQLGNLYHCGDIIEMPIVGPLNAKTWALLFHAVVIGPLVLVPFFDRGRNRRPVEAPFMASAGLGWVTYTIMVSVYSINNVVNAVWPVLGQQYFTEIRKYITLFQLDLLSWLTHLLPLVVFFITYVPLKMVQKQHGYEAKLNASYYRTR